MNKVPRARRKNKFNILKADAVPRIHIACLAHGAERDSCLYSKGIRPVPKAMKRFALKLRNRLSLVWMVLRNERLAKNLRVRLK